MRIKITNVPVRVFASIQIEVPEQFTYADIYNELESLRHNPSETGLKLDLQDPPEVDMELAKDWEFVWEQA